jgi:penicillin V acylase-like amidase (Ntn superfamily)
VLEYEEGPDGTTTFSWKDNPEGLTTNAPKLEQQLQFAQTFKNQTAVEHPGALLMPGVCHKELQEQVTFQTQCSTAACCTHI